MKHTRRFFAMFLSLVCVLALAACGGGGKDGGTVEYRALLYTVSRVRRLNDLDAERSYQEGTIVKVLGIELYNNVE